MASLIPRARTLPSSLKVGHFLSASFQSGAQISRKMSQLVSSSSKGHVALIMITRPEVRNCINPDTAEQLYEAFQNFEKDDNLYVAVLSGKGGYFCGGYDLTALSKMDMRDVVKFSPPLGTNDIGPMGPSRMAFSKPVIAAVEGYAVAGGMEMALLCDMRVVDEKAVMGIFCRRFGVPLLDGGSARLPQLIGLSRALDLILTGRPIKADEALQLGVANRVVKSGTAVEEAIKLAEELCKFPQECLRADRRSAYYSTYDAQSIHDALKYEYNNGIGVVAKESIKGAQNFVSGVGRHGNFKADFSLKDKKSKL